MQSAQKDLSSSHSFAHLTKLYSVISGALPPSVPQNIGPIIASYIPTRAGLSVSSFSHHGPHRDDYPRPLVLLTEPMLPHERVTSLSINMQWKDQGWGNRKGSLFLLHFTSNPGSPPSFKCLTSIPERTSRGPAVFQHTYPSDWLADFMRPNSSGLHWLELWTLTGGGGGHSLSISRLDVTLTRGFAPATFLTTNAATVLEQVNVLCAARAAAAAERLRASRIAYLAAAREAKLVAEGNKAITEATFEQISKGVEPAAAITAAKEAGARLESSLQLVRGQIEAEDRVNAASASTASDVDARPFAAVAASVSPSPSADLTPMIPSIFTFLDFKSNDRCTVAENSSKLVKLYYSTPADKREIFALDGTGHVVLRSDAAYEREPVVGEVRKALAKAGDLQAEALLQTGISGAGAAGAGADVGAGADARDGDGISTDEETDDGGATPTDDDDDDGDWGDDHGLTTDEEEEEEEHDE